MTGSDRMRVKTALDFNVLFYKIRAIYGFTDYQIRHIAFTASELNLQGCGEQVVRTAFKLVGCGRKVAKRRNFLTIRMSLQSD